MTSPAEKGPLLTHRKIVTSIARRRIERSQTIKEDNMLLFHTLFPKNGRKQE
jgi:hypothetical protein